MKTTPAVLLLASASLLPFPLPAEALVTSTRTVACSATTRLQAAIDAVPAGTVATFKVSGTCRENITVPQGKTVIIAGVTATSRITAANGRQAAVTARGDVTLQKMTLTNPAGTADTLVKAERGGVLSVISSDLRAPAVHAVAGAYAGELRITNSRVVGGSGSGLEAKGGATLQVEGDPSAPVGPTGRFETYVSGPGHGIVCGQRANVSIAARPRGTSKGSVAIEQTNYGVIANMCDVEAINETGDQSRLRLKDNEVALWVEHGSASFDGALIADNTAYNAILVVEGNLILQRSSVTGNQLGINAQQGDVRIDASTLSNETGDVRSSWSSSIQFSNWQGPSTLPKVQSWSDSFSCFYGGRIDVDAGSLTTGIGSGYGALTECLFVH